MNESEHHGIMFLGTIGVLGQGRFPLSEGIIPLFF